MERNENGAPIRQRPSVGNNVIENFFEGEKGTEGEHSGNCKKPENGNTGMDLPDSMPLAYAYVPMQKWRRLYSPEEGLRAGTLFEELNKPLGVYGNE